MESVTDMEDKKMNRIEINPAILLGKPVIKGTRIPVYLILELMGAGYTPERIIKNYPDLTTDDIQAAIQFAASMMREEEYLYVDKNKNG